MPPVLVEIGVALIGVGHLQDPRFGKRTRGDLQADRTAVRIEAAVHADRGKAEIVVGPRVGRHSHEFHLGTWRAVIDVGLRERRQAGADGGRDQHIDLGEHLVGEGFQDRAAARQGFDVVGRRNGVAAVHPGTDMDAILPCPLTHPLRVNRRPLDARDDAAIGGDGVHQRQDDRLHRGTALHQHRHGVLHRPQHRWIDAIEEPVRRQSDTQPAHVAVECCLVVRHRLVRTGRIARITSGNHRHHTCTLTRRPCQRSDIVGAERQRHHAVARHAGLRRLDAGDAARRRRQPDRAAGVRAKSHIVEPRRHRRTRAR